MVALVGVCIVIAIFVAVTKGIPKSKKIALILLEITAAFLLLADRLAYAYRGDPSTLGYWMVRISNFSVYFLTIMVLFAFNLYLVDLFKEKRNADTVPLRLKVVKWIALAGVVALVTVLSAYFSYRTVRRFLTVKNFEQE